MPSPNKQVLNELKENIKYSEDAPKGAKELFDLLIDNAGVKIKEVDEGNYLANFVYKPSRINVKKENGALGGETSGTLSVLLSRKTDGQTFVSKDYEHLSLSKLEEMDESALIRRTQIIPGVKAFADGHPVNTEARKAIPYNLSSSGSYDRNNYTQKSILALRQLGTFSSGTYSQDSLASRNVDTFIEQAESTFYNMDLHFTNLVSDEFYRKCGIEESQWGTIRSAMTSFQKDSAVLLGQTLYGQRNDRLKDVGFDADTVSKRISESLDSSGTMNFSLELYTDPILNFISEGDTVFARKYRKEFIDKTLTLMFGSPEIAAESYADHTQIMAAGKTVFSDIVTKSDSGMSPYALDKDIIEMIDAGQYPAKAIAEKMGFKNLSQNQFKRSMALLGRGSHGNIWTAQDFGIDSLENCMALSKIPPNWLSIDGKGNGDIFLDYNVSIMKDKERQFQRFMPFLRQVGVELENLQNSGDKNGAKALAKQWRWLAQDNGKSLYTKIDDIESKYKIEATWGDYNKLISQSMQTVWHRTLMDISEFDASDAVNVYDSQLEIDYDELSKMMKQHLDDEYTENWEPPEYDEDEMDEFCYMPDNPIDEELPSHDMPDAHEITITTISAFVKSSTTSFKEVLDKNAEWHVKSSELTKEMNQAVDNPIVWDGLLPSPVELPDGYRIQSIDSREELLAEGNSMDHCVFNYLGACLSGESTIFSIRDSENNRVATLELNPNESDDDKEPTTYSLGQCFGYNNENISDELDRYVEAFIDDINSGKIDVSPSIGGGDELANIIDEVEMDPLEKGYIISSVPYNTHAAHLDFFTLEKMLPAGATVEGLLSLESECNLEIFSLSAFSKDISLIRELSKKYGIAPDNMVRVALAHNVDKIQNLPETMNVLSNVRTLLLDVEKDDTLPLSPSQKAIKAKSLLEENGFGDYNLDTLTNAYASGNADKSLSMMIMTTAPNEKPDLSEQPDRSIRNEVENEYRLRR